MARSTIRQRVQVVGLADEMEAQYNRGARRIARRPLRLRMDTQGFEQPLGRITGKMSEFQKSMDASVARVFAFGAAVGVINSVQNAMKGLVTQSLAVEKSLKDINVLLELSATNLTKFGNQLFKVAQNTASSFDAIATSAAEFARQGLGAEETLKRVNDAMILTRLSGLDAAKSVETLTAAVNSFQKEALSTTEVVNRLANVDAAFAVSSKDLADAMARAGAAAQSAKVEFNELLAVTAAVQERTARGGAVIGNAFKTIFTRLQRSSVREVLEGIGVATENVNGTFRSATAILNDYAKVYSTLNDQQKAYTAEQVAGVRQIGILKAFIQDLSNSWGAYGRALDVANKTTDQATRRNAELNQTVAALVTQTSLSIQKLAAALGQLGGEDVFRTLLGGVKTFSDMLSGALDPTQGNALVKGFVKGIGNFLSGPGLVIIGAAITKIFVLVTKLGYQAFQQLFNVNKETLRRQNLEAGILKLLQKEDQVYNALTSKQTSMAQKEAMLLNIIKQETAERTKQAALLSQLSGFRTLRGFTAGETGFKPVAKKHSGHIPPGSPIARAERQGAQVEGGYKAGRVVGLTFPSGRQVAANTRETLAYAGAGDPFVNPPQNSPAGQRHRKRAMASTGLDPYSLEQQVISATGFIPNFVRGGGAKIGEDRKQLSLALMKQHFQQTGFVPSSEQIDAWTGKGRTTRKMLRTLFYDEMGGRFAKLGISRPTTGTRSFGGPGPGGGPNKKNILKIMTGSIKEQMSQGRYGQVFWDDDILQADLLGYPERGSTLSGVPNRGNPRYNDGQRITSIAQSALRNLRYKNLPKKYRMGGLPKAKIDAGEQLEAEIISHFKLKEPGNAALDLPYGSLADVDDATKGVMGVNSQTKWGEIKLSNTHENRKHLVTKYLRKNKSKSIRLGERLVAKTRKTKGGKSSEKEWKQRGPNIQNLLPRSGFAMLFQSDGSPDEIGARTQHSLSSLTKKQAELKDWIQWPKGATAKDKKIIQNQFFSKLKYNLPYIADRVHTGKSKLSGKTAWEGAIPNFAAGSLRKKVAAALDKRAAGDANWAQGLPGQAFRNKDMIAEFGDFEKVKKAATKGGWVPAQETAKKDALAKSRFIDARGRATMLVPQKMGLMVGAGQATSAGIRTIFDIAGTTSGMANRVLKGRTEKALKTEARDLASLMYAKSPKTLPAALTGNPSAAAGIVWETAAKHMTGTKIGTSGKARSATWDVVGTPSGLLSDMFSGYQSGYADMKLRAGQPQRLEMAQKIVASQKAGNKAFKVQAGRFGAALGFVPNFSIGASRTKSSFAANLGEAIMAEASGGVPDSRIRIGSHGSIPGGIGVYDAAQGSIGGAIAQHGGITQALQDSASGRAALGDVPNFVPRVDAPEYARRTINHPTQRSRFIGDEMLEKLEQKMSKLSEKVEKGTLSQKDAVSQADKLSKEFKLTGKASEALTAEMKKQAKQAAAQRFQGKYGNRLMMASFMVPMMAGYLPEGEAGTVGGALTGGLQRGAQAGGIGAMLAMSGTPQGLIAGGVVTAIGLITGAIGGWKKDAGELKAEFDKTNASSAKAQNSLRQYTQSQERLNQAYRENNVKDQIRLQKEQRRQFRQITDKETRGQIIAAQGDVDKLNEAYAENAERLQARRQSQETTVMAQQAVDAQSFMDIPMDWFGKGKELQEATIPMIAESLATLKDVTFDELSELKKLAGQGPINNLKEILQLTGVSKGQVPMMDLIIKQMDAGGAAAPAIVAQLISIIEDRLKGEKQLEYAQVEVKLRENLQGDITQIATALTDAADRIVKSFSTISKLQQSIESAQIAVDQIAGGGRPVMERVTRAGEFRYQQAQINQLNQQEAIVKKAFQELSEDAGAGEQQLSLEIMKMYNEERGKAEQKGLGFLGLNFQESIQRLLTKPEWEDNDKVQSTLDDMGKALNEANIIGIKQLAGIDAQNQIAKRAEQAKVLETVLKGFSNDQVRSFENFFGGLNVGGVRTATSRGQQAEWIFDAQENFRSLGIEMNPRLMMHAREDQIYTQVANLLQAVPGQEAVSFNAATGGLQLAGRPGPNQLFGLEDMLPTDDIDKINLRDLVDPKAQAQRRQDAYMEAMSQLRPGLKGVSPENLNKVEDLVRQLAEAAVLSREQFFINARGNTEEAVGALRLGQSFKKAGLSDDLMQKYFRGLVDKEGKFDATRTEASLSMARLLEETGLGGLQTYEKLDSIAGSTSQTVSELQSLPDLIATSLSRALINAESLTIHETSAELREGLGKYHGTIEAKQGEAMRGMEPIMPHVYHGSYTHGRIPMFNARYNADPTRPISDPLNPGRYAPRSASGMGWAQLSPSGGWLSDFLGIQHPHGATPREMPGFPLVGGASYNEAWFMGRINEALMEEFQAAKAENREFNPAAVTLKDVQLQASGTLLPEWAGGGEAREVPEGGWPQTFHMKTPEGKYRALSQAEFVEIYKVWLGSGGWDRAFKKLGPDVPLSSEQQAQVNNLRKWAQPQLAKLDAFPEMQSKLKEDLAGILEGAMLAPTQDLQIEAATFIADLNNALKGLMALRLDESQAGPVSEQLKVLKDSLEGANVQTDKFKEALSDVIDRLIELGIPARKAGSVPRTQARGYVPNFSPFADAVNAEIKYGSRPQDVRWGTDPRLPNGGVYDVNQGSLAGAIADHGGLSAGLRDSRAMQGKARGFVPNFFGGGFEDTPQDPDPFGILQKQHERAMHLLQEKGQFYGYDKEGKMLPGAYAKALLAIMETGGRKRRSQAGKDLQIPGEFLEEGELSQDQWHRILNMEEERRGTGAHRKYSSLAFAGDIARVGSALGVGGDPTKEGLGALLEVGGEIRRHAKWKADLEDILSVPDRFGTFPTEKALRKFQEEWKAEREKNDALVKAGKMTQQEARRLETSFYQSRKYHEGTRYADDVMRPDPLLHVDPGPDFLPGTPWTNPETGLTWPEHPFHMRVTPPGGLPGRRRDLGPRPIPQPWSESGGAISQDPTSTQRAVKKGLSMVIGGRARGFVPNFKRLPENITTEADVDWGGRAVDLTNKDGQTIKGAQILTRRGGKIRISQGGQVYSYDLQNLDEATLAKLKAIEEGELTTPIAGGAAAPPPPVVGVPGVVGAQTSQSGKFPGARRVAKGGGAFEEGEGRSVEELLANRVLISDMTDQEGLRFRRHLSTIKQADAHLDNLSKHEHVLSEATRFQQHWQAYIKHAPMRDTFGQDWRTVNEAGRAEVATSIASQRGDPDMNQAYALMHQNGGDLVALANSGPAGKKAALQFMQYARSGRLNKDLKRWKKDKGYDKKSYADKMQEITAGDIIGGQYADTKPSDWANFQGRFEGHEKGLRGVGQGADLYRKRAGDIVGQIGKMHPIVPGEFYSDGSPKRQGLTEYGAKLAFDRNAYPIRADNGQGAAFRTGGFTALTPRALETFRLGPMFKDPTIPSNPTKFPDPFGDPAIPLATRAIFDVDAYELDPLPPPPFFPDPDPEVAFNTDTDGNGYSDGLEGLHPDVDFNRPGDHHAVDKDGNPIWPDMPRARGFVPNFSKLEKKLARSLGASAGVTSRHSSSFPGNPKINGQGFFANNEEDVWSADGFARDFGVRPRGGDAVVIPRYGKVGQERQMELMKKLSAASGGQADGFVPNFQMGGAMPEIKFEDFTTAVGSFTDAVAVLSEGINWNFGWDVTIRGADELGRKVISDIENHLKSTLDQWMADNFNGIVNETTAAIYSPPNPRSGPTSYG